MISQSGRHGGVFQMDEFARRATHLAQAFFIAPHLGIFGKKRLHLLEQPRDGPSFRFRDPVMNPLPFPPRSHQARPAQEGQMPGDFRLADSEDFDQITDANLPPIHQVEQPEPRAIGEKPEQPFEGRSGGAGSRSSHVLTYMP